MKRLSLITGCFTLALSALITGCGPGDPDSSTATHGGSESATESSADACSQDAMPECDRIPGDCSDTAPEPVCEDGAWECPSGAGVPHADAFKCGSTSGFSDDSTGDLGEEALCEQSAGTWDENGCGHSFCGNTRDCDSPIPGCTCGVDEVFVEAEGCVMSEACGA